MPGTAAPMDPQASAQIAAIRAKGGVWADLADQMQAKLGGLGTGTVAGTPPLPARIQQAIDQYGQYARGGNLGFSALTGNAGAQQQFMSPYLAQMNPFFAQQRQQ